MIVYEESEEKKEMLKRIEKIEEEIMMIENKNKNILINIYREEFYNLRFNNKS